jgi:hypothetical protein
LNENKIISKEEVKGVFGEVEVILGLNSFLLKELSDRLSNWSYSTKIGDIFLRMVIPFIYCFFHLLTWTYFHLFTFTFIDFFLIGFLVLDKCFEMVYAVYK